MAFRIQDLNKSDLEFFLRAVGGISHDCDLTVSVLREKWRAVLDFEDVISSRNISPALAKEVELLELRVAEFRREADAFCAGKGVGRNVMVSRLHGLTRRLSIVVEADGDGKFSQQLQLINSAFLQAKEVILAAVLSEDAPVARAENVEEVIPGHSLDLGRSEDVRRSGGYENGRSANVRTGSGEFYRTYSKFQNPVSTLLLQLSVSDGSSAEDILSVLRVSLKILRLYPEVEESILSLLLPYTQGQLQECLLTCLHLSFDDFHAEVLKKFFTLRRWEELKWKCVLRPQTNLESFPEFIHGVRDAAKLLRVSLSEEELVKHIVANANSKVRACFVFQREPNSFQDLERLCDVIKEIQEAEKMRSSSEASEGRSCPRASFPSRTNYTQGNRALVGQNRQPPVCTFCKKVGHWERTCFRKVHSRQTKNL